MESASFRLAVRAFLMHAVPQRLVLARTDTGSREGRGAATRKRGAREQDVRSETPCVGRFIVTGAGLTAVLQPVDVRVAAQCFRKPPGARVRHAPEAEGGREDAATGASMFRGKPGFGLFRRFFGESGPGFSTGCPHPDGRPGTPKRAGLVVMTGRLIRSLPGGPPRDAARPDVRWRPPPG